MYRITYPAFIAILGINYHTPRFGKVLTKDDVCTKTSLILMKSQRDFLNSLFRTLIFALLILDIYWWWLYVAAVMIMGVFLLFYYHWSHFLVFVLL